MTKFIANLITLAMASVLVLMAVESTSILKWFGYTFGGLLFVAVLLNWSRASKD